MQFVFLPEFQSGDDEIPTRMAEFRKAGQLVRIQLSRGWEFRGLLRAHILRTGDERTEHLRQSAALLQLALMLVVTVLMTSIAFGQRVQWIPREGVLSDIHRWTQPFYLFNSYGLFASMTTERPEVVIEGSMDGRVWREYNFRWKIDEPGERPQFVAPYHPRLDWQMWFAALRPDIRYAPWVENLMLRLAGEAPEVMRLLGEENNPFPDGPPRYLRARIFDYQFTSPRERRETGHWWNRRYLRPYSLTYSNPSGHGRME